MIHPDAKKLFEKKQNNSKFKPESKEEFDEHIRYFEAGICPLCASENVKGGFYLFTLDYYECVDCKYRLSLAIFEDDSK